MDKNKLSVELRRLANKMIDEVDPDALNYEDIKDAAELARVLARVVEGQPLEKAFGAPGDWGYQTPIGKALAARQEGES